MKPMKLLLITLLIALQYQVRSDEIPAVDCTKQADGTRLVDPGSCTNYYKCLRGVPIRKACHVGYYFDDVKFECNYAALVDCKRARNTPIVDEDLGVAGVATQNCTTPCPIINPVTCLCGNNNHHYGNWPWPLPYPYPYPYPYPPYPPHPPRHHCNETTTTTISPITHSPCTKTPCTCTPSPSPAPCPNTNTNPAPCPAIQCGCTNAPCTCATTLATPTDAAKNGTATSNVEISYMEHPISKRLYYEVKNGKKRLRKCSKGQVFDLATTSCKLSA